MITKICITRYPIHIGLNEGIISPMEPHGLPTDVETLADLLLAAGYSTHAVGRIAGKWTTTKKGAFAN